MTIWDSLVKFCKETDYKRAYKLRVKYLYVRQLQILRQCESLKLYLTN